jgi:hypothetical protein
MTRVSVRVDRNPPNDRDVWSDVAVEPPLKPRHKNFAARAAFPESSSQVERRQTSAHHLTSPSELHSDNPQAFSPTPSSEPRLSAVIWAVLVCGALRPFAWMVRCRCCWRGRCRAVIGQHHGHLRVLQVCRVCDAARPFPAWLQPS